MNKIFNVSADCKPNLHYMVDIGARLEKIKVMVDAGQYFTINRARQYGKTTTLKALGKLLEKEYAVISLDFQMLGENSFQTENMFSLSFAKMILRALKRQEAELTDKVERALANMGAAVKARRKDFILQELFEYLSDICAASDRPMVLLIDEVDSAANNQVFLDFLAQLRAYYINRDELSTFQSVILSGVYDVKNLKSKLRSSDGHKVNSPWNIAADFLVDMSFSVEDIAGMLREYERDYRTGMDIEKISEWIYDYTSGYPFLVSRICKLIDERVSGSTEFPDKKSAWKKDDADNASLVLSEVKECKRQNCMEIIR